VRSIALILAAPSSMEDLLEPPLSTQVAPKSRRRGITSRSWRFNRILVPVDFSRPSLNAISYALAVSRQFGGDLRVLHVVDTTQFPPPTLLTLPLLPQSELERRLTRQLQAVVLKYGTDGDVSALPLRTGTAYEEICAAARELKAELIVIATHGYTGYKHLFLGSTAERVVQHSPCPVLVVRPHVRHWNGAKDTRTRRRFRPTKILVPTDFSGCSQAAFDCGVRLARNFKAELCLVHVINPHAYPFGDKYAALDPAELMQETEGAAQKQMRSMAAKAKARYSVRVIHGSPAVEICNVADEDVDLIVIATHGRTGLGHVLIGSVAEHVVRYAHCPVLVIPSRPDPKSPKECDQT
jgi:nucleotide-binding universal stress UspA family protein